MRIALAGTISLEPLRSWLYDIPLNSHVVGTNLGSPVAELARGLLECGHEVVVVSLDKAVEQETLISGERLRVRFGRYRPRHRARDAFRSERRYVSSVLKRERPDVVHAHWTYEYALGALQSDAPTLVTVRDWAPRDFFVQPTPYRAVRLCMNLATIARARHLTVTSPYMRTRLERWGRPPTAVIPNALADTWFHKRRNPPNRERPTLLTVNQGFGKLKNVQSLLRSFPIVLSSRPAASLRLVGPAYAPNGPAHRWAMAHRLDANVEFLGEVPHQRLPTIMRQADLFVHPSLQESLGMVVIEAMASGLPVVGGIRSGAVPWLLDSGAAGVLADVRSPNSIAAAVDDALRDEERWWRLSNAGYARAYDLFRGSRVVEQYVALYERILAGANVSAGGATK